MESLKPGYHRIPNRCIDRRQCQLHHVCPKERCYRQCNTCYQSNEYRMKFREERCPKLQMTPYVCNGCREENRCTLRKQFYVHDTAEKSYRKMLVCSRSGASITEVERLFLCERIDQEIQKRAILPSYSCIRRRSDHGGKKDRVSLHQCRFTSNQTRRYASFLLKLVRLNARKRCPQDLPESVSKTKRTSPLLNSPKSTFTFAIHLNL